MLVVIMIVAIMVALVIGFAPRLNLFGGGEGAVHKTNLQSNIYTMDHALGAARLYMDTALDYSVYQACYDNLRRAGQSYITTGTGEQGYGYLLDMDSEEFHDELRETTETYFNRYRQSSYSFMTDYKVVIPSSQIEITENGGGFSVDALSTEKLSITRLAESGETITLKASGSASGGYFIPCYTLFQKGIELNPEIETDFQAALDYAFHWEIMLDDTRCQSNEECSPLIRENLDNNVTAVFSREEGDYTISAELLDVSVAVSVLEDSVTGVVTQNYVANAIQKVTTSKTSPPDEEFYPMWNGKEISFEDMELVHINRASDKS